MLRALVLAALAGLAACSTPLDRVDLAAPAAADLEPVLQTRDGAPIRDAADWAAHAGHLREIFQREIYGYFPDRSGVTVLDHAVVDDNAFGGLGVFETWDVQVSAQFGASSVDTGAFVIDVVLPRSGRPIGVVMMQTFCPRTDAVPHPAVSSGGPGVSCNGGAVSWVMRRAFRRVVARPPMEAFLERGYAVASMHSRDVVPDDPRAGIDALNSLAPERSEDDTRWGAIGAWAWLYSRMIDVLSADPRLAGANYIALGHSRFGKAALVAGAFDARIAAVIANQSGTGGAALARGGAGESIAQITLVYPHWFATRYEAYAGRESDLPVDQHELLALIAPRPIFLGGARRDRWADPLGSYRAALEADPVYELLGARGLDQADIGAFNAAGGIAFWLRRGFHGVEPEDWQAMLAFLEAHFGAWRNGE